MKILYGNLVYFNNRLILEKMTLNKVSEGLSKFYSQKVEVNLNNLPLFEGDIKALFFDFKQPLFLAVCSNGAIYTDESNSMEEFIFQLKQRGVKNIKRVKQL